MVIEKWNFYIESLQGHPTRCNSSHTKDGLSFIRNKLPLGKMLVIGCGEGKEVAVLKALGYDPIGITLGDTNLNYAKITFPDCDIRIMDMHFLDFPSEYFDCAYSNHSFEHSFAPWIQMMELWRVLKPNGKIWIAMPHFRFPNDRNFGEVNEFSHHHPNLLHPELLKQLFKNTGFKILEHAQNKEGNLYFDNYWLLEKDQDASSAHPDMRRTLKEAVNRWK